MRSTFARRAIALATVPVLLAGLIGAPAIAREPAAAGAIEPQGTLPGECPAALPVSQADVGDVGTGWTVARGRAREKFKVEILGVLDDGIAPGRDLVVIEVSDIPNSTIIAEAGGIWAGMSGSPVYLNGKLLGAVAYTLSGGASRVGGVTPATDMLKILQISGGPSARSEAPRVSVPREMRVALARRAGVSTAQASSFERLRVPFSVSGLSGRGREQLQDSLEASGISSIVTPGSAVARPTGGTSFGTPKPGGNFAALISYGDVTAGGVGTTTYVCGNRALAFGHPLAFLGASRFGANNADAITIVRDDIFGPYKLATIAGLFGIVNQDRLAGLGVRLGVAPTLIPVTSTVTNLDLDRSRNGRTDITMSDFVPNIAVSHLLANLDVVFDRVGEGSSRVTWTLTGKRENGSPWSLQRTNRYASNGDITFESVFELFEQLAAIQFNSFEDVRFTGVQLSAQIEQTVRTLTMQSVRISKNGGEFKQRSSLTVKGGDKLVIRVNLRRTDGSIRTEDLNLTVPAGAGPDAGILSIAGGSSLSNECRFDPVSCADSFSELLDVLENAPRNNELIAELFSFENGTIARRALVLGAVVRGSREIETQINP